MHPLITTHPLRTISPFFLCRQFAIHHSIKTHIIIIVNSGYVRQFRGLKEYLMQQDFWDQIDLVAIADPGVTGNFEITTGDGQLLHSKRTGGQGRCESPKERAMLVEQILELLE